MSPERKSTLSFWEKLVQFLNRSKFLDILLGSESVPGVSNYNACLACLGNSYVFYVSRNNISISIVNSVITTL